MGLKDLSKAEKYLTTLASMDYTYRERPTSWNAYMACWRPRARRAAGSQTRGREEEGRGRGSGEGRSRTDSKFPFVARNLFRGLVFFREKRNKFRIP